MPEGYLEERFCKRCGDSLGFAHRLKKYCETCGPEVRRENQRAHAARQKEAAKLRPEPKPAPKPVKMELPADPWTTIEIMGAGVGPSQEATPLENLEVYCGY